MRDEATMQSTYRLIRLAPGSYDVELDGEVVASLVRGGDHGHHSATWHVELLDDAAVPPSPFSAPVHEFASFDEAATWLGHPDVVMLARVALEFPVQRGDNECVGFLGCSSSARRWPSRAASYLAPTERR
jgi:hypothetical protein